MLKDGRAEMSVAEKTESGREFQNSKSLGTKDGQLLIVEFELQSCEYLALPGFDYEQSKEEFLLTTSQNKGLEIICKKGINH